jgi:hypothetical protein
MAKVKNGNGSSVDNEEHSISPRSTPVEELPQLHAELLCLGGERTTLGEASERLRLSE